MSDIHEPLYRTCRKAFRRGTCSQPPHVRSLAEAATRQASRLPLACHFLLQKIPMRMLHIYPTPSPTLRCRSISGAWRPPPLHHTKHQVRCLLPSYPVSYNLHLQEIACFICCICTRYELYESNAQPLPDLLTHVHSAGTSASRDDGAVGLSSTGAPSVNLVFEADMEADGAASGALTPAPGLDLHDAAVPNVRPWLARFISKYCSILSIYLFSGPHCSCHVM